MISPRFSAISSASIPSPVRPVSMPANLLLNLICDTLVLYRCASRLNVKPGTGASDSSRLFLAHLFRPVAFDVLAVIFDLSVRALLAPAEVLHGDLGGGLVHVEADPRAESRHRAPKQHVGEGLGHLTLESVQDLSPYDPALECGRRGERQAQRGVVAGHLEHFRRKNTVDLEEPLGQLVSEAARRLEVSGEGGEVLRGAAWQGHLVRAALRGLAA